MIKVIYSGNDFKKIEKEVLKAFDFVYKKFLIKIPNITVRVYTTREEFNKYIGEKTATWIIANASDNNEIAILSPSAMKRDSIHSSQEFLPVLKHEFTHLFIEKLAAGKTVPKWLNEGLAQYIAKQYKDAKYVVKTAELVKNLEKNTNTRNPQWEMDGYKIHLTLLRSFPDASIEPPIIDRVILDRMALYEIGDGGYANLITTTNLT